MEITQHEDNSKGYVKAMEDGKEAGRITYVWTGIDKIIIDHTEVDPTFGGRGVGKKLLMALVEFARNKNIKIVPLCPFAKAMFDKMEEIRDVL